MNAHARLVVPALRWDPAHGFGYLDALIDDALTLGVGGFLVVGGPRDAAAGLIGRLHAASHHPLLIAAHAERGAGGAFAGVTELPPLGAVASVAVVPDARTGAPGLDAETVRRAARITARELRGLGANWAVAPFCGLDVSGGDDPPGVRSAGDDPAVVGAIAAEWVDACQAEAVIACAHPFHGADLRPFTAAVDAGVASVMMASPTAKSLHEAIAALRQAMGFEGLLSTAPLDHDDTIAPGSEPNVAVALAAAGCDVILAPRDLDGVCAALARAAEGSVIPAPRAREALSRVDRWAGWARPSPARESTLEDILWARQLADRAVYYVRGARPRIGGTVEVVVARPASAPATVTAGVLARGGSAAPPDHTPFLAVLQSLHIAVTESSRPTAGERSPLVVLSVPRRASTGVVGDDERDAVHALARAGVAGQRDVAVVVCGHPRAAAAITGRLAGEASVLCGWDASRPMLEAAARALVTAR